MNGKPELKPGIMAITHGLVVDVGCNDMLVELIELVPGGVIWEDPHGNSHRSAGGLNDWAVVSLGGPFPVRPALPATRYALFRPRNLRPINNPGDDEVDESHAWLPPVPSEVTA